MRCCSVQRSDIFLAESNTLFYFTFSFEMEQAIPCVEVSSPVAEILDFQHCACEPVMRLFPSAARSTRMR